MEKTKFVTMFYAYHGGEPIWGQNGRENWYRFSLISICNLGTEIVCYTDFGDKGENQLKQLKEDFNLDNLTIKTYDITQNPYQQQIYDMRMRHPEKYNNPEIGVFYCGSPQIYWTKFDLMKKEVEENINLYWIDCGLSHPGLFPLHGKRFEEEYKHYVFEDYFNPATVERLNNFNEGKIINIGRIGITNNNMGDFNRAINEQCDYDSYFPNGGFFGGNSNLIPQYVDELKKIIDKVLSSEDDYFCVDEQIMAHVNYYHKDWFKNFVFDCFCFDDPNQLGLCDTFTDKLK